MLKQKFKNAASKIPSLGRLIQTDYFKVLEKDYGKTLIKEFLRSYFSNLRVKAKNGNLTNEHLDVNHIFNSIEKNIKSENQSKLKKIFNLTGTVLHTNFGRALLPNEAIDAIVRISNFPINLEFDLDNGKRGDRDLLLEDLLCKLTEAESATIVNNNAAAVFLMLNTLGKRREVIVSRGELVEIGGTFRIPDIMKSAGVRLIEVGTTNCTHEIDYKNAITEHTAMIMKINCSNYKISGFTKSVCLENIVHIGHSANIPVSVDLGSGLLLDFAKWGLPKEKTVKEILKLGADLVTFSGDKLLGGPQAGLLVGRANLISKIKKNPLKRILRVNKLIIAALESVLNLYKTPEFLDQTLPTLRLLTRSQEDIQQISELIKPILQKFVGSNYFIEVISMFSQIGSGTFPIEKLPSYGFIIRSNNKGKLKKLAIHSLEKKFKNLSYPIIGRISDNAIWLDMRCLEFSEKEIFINQLME
ncbi:MAG: L-seryl-tRNA(Sec) selenium transferase [Bordetella sp.]|nr:MAG: L-seryl-tRNA(Sec) selenium transferase [Bordetella sp.]